MCNLYTLVIAGQPFTHAICGDSGIALANAAALARFTTHDICVYSNHNSSVHI